MDLFCNSGTVWDLFWQYCTTSENSKAKQLKDTSPLPRLKGLSRILKRVRFVRLIFDILKNKHYFDK